MSDELQKNYEIFEVNHEECKYLILRRFCHSIEQQNQAIMDELNEKGYKGWVLFDQLFKGGNTSRRYGKQMFNNNIFVIITNAMTNFIFFILYLHYCYDSIIFISSNFVIFQNLSYSCFTI